MASFFVSCHGPEVWGLSRDEILRSIDRGDYVALGAVDEAALSDALALGPEAPWCLALNFAKAGRVEDSRKLLTLGASRSPEPYRSLCALELIRVGSEEARLSSVEALLAAKRDDAPNSPSVGKLRAALSDDALRSLRLSLLVSLNRFDEAFGPDAAIVAIRSAAYRRSWKEAWEKTRPILLAADSSGTLDPRFFSDRALVSDLGKSALYGAPEQKEIAPLFDRLSKIAPRSSGELRYLLTFYAGRLYGKKSDIALERFTSAAALAPSAPDRDAAIWYALEASMAQGDGLFLETAEKWSASWDDPSYFDDILDSFVVSASQRGAWESIAKLRAALPETVDSELLARLNYIAARSGSISSSAVEASYRAAFSADRASLYYRALAGAALGLEPDSGENLVAGSHVDSKATSERAAPPEDESRAAALRALVSWSLEDRVYGTAERLYPDCPPALARELAAALSRKGRYGDSIRLISLALRLSDATITKEDLSYLYPRPWIAEVSAAASRYGVPEYVLYALIRSESYFQADAVSPAGAQGLTQLMPPTAADMARKAKLDSFDILDPGTNIDLGARYLSELARRLDGDYMAALYAYNAGITNVRAWQKKAAHGGAGELFLEGLPYSETRGYGRKVLAAAVVYGYLYYQKTAGDVVRELF